MSEPNPGLYFAYYKPVGYTFLITNQIRIYHTSAFVFIYKHTIKSNGKDSAKNCIYSDKHNQLL